MVRWGEVRLLSCLLTFVSLSNPRLAVRIHASQPYLFPYPYLSQRSYSKKFPLRFTQYCILDVFFIFFETLCTTTSGSQRKKQQPWSVTTWESHKTISWKAPKQCGKILLKMGKYIVSNYYRTCRERMIIKVKNNFSSLSLIILSSAKKEKKFLSMKWS